MQDKWQQLSDSARGDWQMRLSIRLFREQEHVVLEIEDNGDGMAEETRVKMLEPFFTTKGPDKGTGWDCRSPTPSSRITGARSNVRVSRARVPCSG
jgi:hypothetical protein